MKHLIIFLNYNKSRLDNPVYQRFSETSADKQLATLLFMPTKPEERDLLHHVNEIRQKNADEDVTFYICCKLTQQTGGDLLLNTLRLIRRLFPTDDTHRYSIVVFGKCPNLSNMSQDAKRLVWDNLNLINKAVLKYEASTLLECFYLDADSSYKTMAEFLFQTIKAGITSNDLSCGVTTEAGQSLWAPIFRCFNASGISYPETEIREFLQNCYIRSVVRYAQPDFNPTKTEDCVFWAEKIAANIPLSTKRITLQEDGFLNLTDELTTWPTIDGYWKQEMQNLDLGLDSLKRQEWISEIDKHALVNYQNRFRQVGVEYFFKNQTHKTDEYNHILLSIITEKFNECAQTSGLIPGALHSVVNALINLLQQKVLELQHEEERIKEQVIPKCERELKNTEATWNKLNIFSRIVKKDTKTLDLYKKLLTQTYIYKSQVLGFNFAVKLLNELISLVANLNAHCDALNHNFQEADSHCQLLVDETNPSPLFGIFKDSINLTDIIHSIENDKETHLAAYKEMVKMTYAQIFMNGADLATQYKLSHISEINHYLDSHIANGEFAPVLNQSILNRIDKMYTGGIGAFLENLKKEIPINITLKDSYSNNNAIEDSFKPQTEPKEDYLYVLPKNNSLSIDKALKVFPTDNESNVALIHINAGITMPYLDGFTGQRVTLEPALF